MKLEIRRAEQSDALTLSSLALRSKAHWPYDDEFIRDCADDLKISESRAGSGLLFVGEINDVVIGFYGFECINAEAEMTHLFVDPSFIGKGLGKMLWHHAIDFAKSKGWQSFLIIADPYASDHFYIPMGARCVGEIPSSVRPGRKLPLLKFDCPV
jgi:GNAT superfamily N-acetyltransferase